MKYPEPLSFWQQALDPAGIAPDPLPAQADVVVVGGGILGTATTYWLARAGVRPLLLERGPIGNGASGRNGGMMVIGTAEAYPAATRRLGPAAARSIWELTMASQALLGTVLEAEAIDCDYRPTGHLKLTLGGDQLTQQQEVVAALHADGFAAEVLDRRGLQELICTPLGPEITGARFLPNSGTVHSGRLVSGLALAARRHGAQLGTGVEVLQIEATDGALQIETDQGALTAGGVVVAANAWTGDLLPELAGCITPVRGQALAYAPIERVFTTGIGVRITATEEYWQQAADGTIVLGGCRAVAPGHDIGVRDLTVSDDVQHALEAIFPRLFPALSGLRVTRRWAGAMGFTSDHLPIVDQAPELPGVWFAGGFSGYGMKFGLRLGQLLAEAATQGTRPAALDPFRRARPSLMDV